MKPIRLLILAALATLALTVSAADNGFKSLFDGKTLKGWAGLESYWSVRDGTITGQNHGGKAAQDQHVPRLPGRAAGKLRVPRDVQTHAKQRQGLGNSGVQYRSKVVDAAGFVVAGYQADIDSNGRYTGMLYEEKGRGILMNPGEKIKVGATTVDPANAKKRKRPSRNSRAPRPPRRSCRSTSSASGTNCESSRRATTCSTSSMAS
jgi:hypothetical protein